MKKQRKCGFKGQTIDKDVLTQSTADSVPTEETELAFHKIKQALWLQRAREIVLLAQGRS